jgi:hypothetical protein
MKTTLVLLVVAVLAVPSLMAAERPEIIIINSVPVDFAPFTITNNLTARMNAVMGAEPHLNAGFDCAGVVEMRFLDAAGGVLARKTARISPTAVESLEFTPAREAAGRMIVRPQISWVEWPPGPCRGTVLANTEVYSNETGNTQFVTHGIIIVNSSQQ